MAIEIQFAMRDMRDDHDRHIDRCRKSCDGTLYYPDVSPSQIGREMDTFYAIYECTECDNNSNRANTAPRYLTWRVVVRV